MAMHIYQAPDGSLSWWHEGEAPVGYVKHEPKAAEEPKPKARRTRNKAAAVQNK